MKKILSLILIASMILSITPVMAMGEEIILNCKSPEYKEIGNLFLTSAIVDQNGEKTRYSYSEDAKIVYSPVINTTGNYEVFYFNAANKTNASQQEFVVNSDNGEAKVTFYLKENPGWKSLGVYKFSAGSSASISFSRSLMGGCIRSGAIKLVSTTSELKIAKSEPKPGINLADLKGIVISTSSEGYSEVAGKIDYSTGTNGNNFFPSGLVDCRGQASKYAMAEGDAMIYTPNIPTDGEYSVFYYVIPHSTNLKNVSVTVHYDGGEKNFTLDCVSLKGWVYLGKFKFTQGTSGYLKAQKPTNGEGFLRSGGARFDNDPNLDVSSYAKPEDAATTATAPVTPIASATPSAPTTTPVTPSVKGGSLSITAKTAGYAEAGGQFYESQSLMDPDGKTTRYSNSKGTTMTYVPTITESGSYEVSFYLVSHATNSTNQKFIVNYAKGQKEITLDCTKNGGWVSLGTYEFEKGSSGYVQSVFVSNMMRSGAVKFEKK